MKQLNKINEWVMSNKTKLYWTGGGLLGLLILSPLILRMPEFFLGLIGGVVLTLILKKFVLDKLIERRSIKLNVKRTEPDPEPEPETISTGVQPERKPSGITVPSVSDKGNGDGQIHDGSPTDEVERTDEGHRDIQDTPDKPDDESERISEEPRSDPIRTDGEDESNVGEDREKPESNEHTTGDSK